MMKAVAVTPGAHNSLHVREDAPEPYVGPGDALIRVVEAGVCGTDAEIHEGLYGQAPADSPFLILGHENLGVIERAPADSGLAAGDLVVSTVRRPCPEACLPCASDQNDMCLTGNFSERGISRLHGFMSERYVESPRYVVKLPSQLRGCAVLLEPLSIIEKAIEQTYRIQDRLAWEPRTAVVLGAGPVGILAAAAFRLRGFETCVASTGAEGSFKDALLREAGVRYISTRTTPIDSLPAKLGRIDVMFEATGATSAVAPSLRILGPNGVAILSSVTGGSKSVEVDIATWNREMVLGNRLVFGTVNAGRRHFEMGVRDMEAAEERLPGWLGRLLTRHLHFTEAPRALQRSPDDIKVVLDFN
jgi:threonine dehydrogenase-like Zn-dependent dehydrogenase